MGTNEDADLEALSRGGSEASRLLALSRLARSGRTDLKSLLEPIAHKDRSIAVRFLAQRVLELLDGAPAGFGELDPEPLSASGSGSRKRPTALVAALKEASSRPVPRSIADEPTEKIPVLVPRPSAPAPRPAASPPPAAPPPPPDPEALRLEAAALSVFKPCVRQLAGMVETRDDELAAEAALALGRLRIADAYELIAGRARSAPPDERFVKALGELGEPRAAEMLARFWGDARWAALRPAIGVAACRVPSSRAEEFLRGALAGEDLAVQGAIIRHLGASGDARFVDVLLEKLGRVQEFFEVLVIQALARFAPRDERVVHALLERLPREENARTASCIIAALSETGDPRLVEAIERLIKQRDRRVRANAVDAVEPLGVDAEVKARILKPLLGDEDNRVRANAARQLAQAGDRAALEALRAMLAHQNKWWRASACHALGTCRPPGCAALIGRALRDPELDVRLNATKALREVQDPSVPQLLMSLLSDKNLYIRMHAVETIAARGLKAAASALRGTLKTETSPQVIAAGLVALAKTASADGPRDISAFLTHAASQVRLAAVEALEPLLDGESVAALKPALADADRKVRAAAARAFVRCGQLKVASILHDGLVGTDRAEQVLAAHTVGEVASIVRGLRDGTPPPRLAEALRKLPAYAAEGGRA